MSRPERTDPRRRIPGVDALLNSREFEGLLASRSRATVTEALRRALDDLRDEMSDGSRDEAPSEEEILARTVRELRAMDRPSLRGVINATGVALHTNLGRAPLPGPARAALDRVAAGYSNLEYDVESGRRGSRHDLPAGLLRELTGAEDALVVNNNAAAVVLALNELADGRQVVISRGELVEIGGSFRVPEIIAKSGARIAEVGSTNRTHAADYEEAIGPDTGALLKVHRSNFQQTGFVADVPIAELAQIGRRAGVPVIHDLGSGLLDASWFELAAPHEPDVAGSLDAGADLVTFSADKLLGGPQAGIVLGRSELIRRMRVNPLLRAFRVGKLTLAALEATLRLWRDEETARAEIPAVRTIMAAPEDLKARAEALAGRLAERAPDALVQVRESVTQVGGGSYPGSELPTWLIRIETPDLSETELEARCRAADPPVVGVIRDGALCLDPRTVSPEEEADLIKSVVDALGDEEARAD